MTRNGVVFAVCLLLAFSLLALNKLSRKYIGEVKARITYVQMPEGKIPSSPLPADLKLFIETTGFKLLWNRMRKPVQVQINLSALKVSYVPTAELKSVISSQLSADYKLIDIFPDTLYFNFDKGIKKKVPVLPDILISFRKKFDFTEPMKISPDSILVTGPEQIVDTILFWKTTRITFENLDKSVQNEISMLPPAFTTVSISPDKVRYTIAVEEYTEKTMDVDIEKINITGNKSINIYPNKAKLVFRVGLSNYENVKAETFKAVADFSGIDFHKTKYVPVRIIRAPAHIKNLDYSPKSVEYILYR